jgi:hypothetical protein
MTMPLVHSPDGTQLDASNSQSEERNQQSNPINPEFLSSNQTLIAGSTDDHLFYLFIYLLEWCLLLLLCFFLLLLLSAM